MVGSSDERALTHSGMVRERTVYNIQMVNERRVRPDAKPMNSKEGKKDDGIT